MIWTSWASEPWHALMGNDSRVTACDLVAPVVNRQASSAEIPTSHACRTCLDRMA